MADATIYEILYTVIQRSYDRTYFCNTPSVGSGNYRREFRFVPGAGRCSTNFLQPSLCPQSNTETILDRAEGGVKLSCLNAIVSSCENAGGTQLRYRWPTRPLWRGKSSISNCVNDMDSINNCIYTFDSFKLPIYYVTL
ncbi:hypothetical protein F4782DRAFT_524213 [Xylaria castorea]|nr:hypothetical protein F4782DRAFT_524213 [Xylaria castorea]